MKPVLAEAQHAVETMLRLKLDENGSILVSNDVVLPSKLILTWALLPLCKALACSILLLVQLLSSVICVQVADRSPTPILASGKAVLALQDNLKD